MKMLANTPTQPYVTKEIRDIGEGEKRYQCCECSFQTNKRSDMTRHQYRHTGGRPKPHRCDMCEYASAYRSALNSHRRIHLNLRPYQCHLCANYSTTSPAELNRHVRVRHGPSTGPVAERRYKCEECHYATDKRDHFTRHQYKHSGEKPHHCDLCAFSTADPFNLRHHYKSKHAETLQRGE